MPVTTPLASDDLAAFLRDRRGRVSPGAAGFAVGRRRTAGLRREEVAVRAAVSTTWYAWLEQGRAAHPSADVLDRVAVALRLGAADREHLFLLAHGRPPPRTGVAAAVVTPRVRRLLDGLDRSPAYVYDACWNVVAWNAAATAVLTDYGKLPVGRRNILRQVFTNPAARTAMADWEATAPTIVGHFRGDLARFGPNPAAEKLVADLRRESPLFARWWGRRDVTRPGEGTKRLRHAVAGPIALDYVHSTLDESAGLSLTVFTPAGAADRDRVDALVRGRATGG